MQGAAFQALGLDARYLALDVADFAAGWAAVRRLEVRGGNVTVPWKEAAARALDLPAPETLRTRSANTFWRTSDGRLAGTQTDGEGFVRSLQEDFAIDPRGLRVAVLGAGGGGRAVLHALAERGAAALYLWNRAPDRAWRLAKELRAFGYGGELAVIGHRDSQANGAAAAPGDAPALPRGHEVDLLVNATSVGLGPADPAPADPRGFPGLRFAIDLIYGPIRTRFLDACARLGARVADGRGMLLHQGARSFELWLGRPAPLEAMRAALTRELSGPRPR